MRNMRPHLIILLLFALAACRTIDELPSATATRETPVPTATPVLPAAETFPEATPLNRSAADAGSPNTQDDDQSASVPAPTLFENSWDEKDIFGSGLIAGQKGVLDALPGASIYHLKMNIDEPTAVSGKMEVRYSNQEEITLDEIYFHLFANQLGGSISVSNVSVNGSAVEPDVTETALRVPLQTALDPGEAAVVQMDFITTVPVEESTKYNILAFDEDILALAHFYPMIAVYDDREWHTEPSPPHGDETYADMSLYLLQVTAPLAQVIASTGVEIDRSETESTQTITLAAGPVRDFYLAMSERYGVVSDNAGPVQINSYAPLELLDGAEVALDSAAFALRSFNERFGPYPYSELDIVSTPTLANGVEYPGIFANAVRMYDLSTASTSGLPNAILLESVSVHETAHQWFYNLVGNDQLNEPWLDEATAQYATWMYFIDRYGEENAQGYYDSLEGRWARIDFADIAIGMPAEAYSGRDYGAIVYGRGPIFLNDLAQEMGQERFDAFLLDYGESFRWQIATSEEFQTLAEEHCQCDLSALFNEAVYAN